MMWRSLGRKALAAAVAGLVASLAGAPARGETRAVYLNSPGDPYNFTNSGVSPGELRGFTASFGEIPAGMGIKSLYFSYGSGYEADGGWGWYIPPGDGSTQGRVDWIMTGMTGTLLVQLTSGETPGAMGAMATNSGDNPARRTYFSPVASLFTQGTATIWIDLGGQVLAPSGAYVAQPRFWGYWPYLTLELSEIPATEPVNGLHDGSFEEGSLDKWSSGGGNGTAAVVDRAAGKAVQLAVGDAGPMYLSQLSREGTDTGVVSFDMEAMTTGSTLRVFMDNREITQIAAPATPAQRRFYAEVPLAARGVNKPLTFMLEGAQGQSVILDNVAFAAQQIWQNPIDPRDGGPADFMHAGNVAVEHANGAILWGTRNDNGIDTADRQVTITGDLTIDEFSWARTQTRGGPGDSPTMHVIQGALINHGLLSLGTPGDEAGLAANGGSDLNVKGAFHSDARVDVNGRTLIIDGNVMGSLSGQVTLAGGTFCTTNGAALASMGVRVDGTGTYDVAYADGSAIGLRGAIKYVLEGDVQTVAPNGGAVAVSGKMMPGGQLKLTGGVQTTLGLAGIDNAGMIGLMDTGTILATPADADPANWRELAITGAGVLGAGPGTGIDLAAGVQGAASQRVRVENLVVVASGATLSSSRIAGVNSGENRLAGGLFSNGAVMLGSDASPGSSLRVSGSFYSDGVIKTKDATLIVDNAPGSTLAGSLALAGGGLRAEGPTVFSTSGLSIAGEGAVDAFFVSTGVITRNLNQTAGAMRVAGGQVVWSGGVAAGASLELVNGAFATIPAVTEVRNDGVLSAEGGSTLFNPAFTGEGIHWPERRINGSGTISIGPGGLLALDAVYYANSHGWQMASPLVVENNVTVASGGSMQVQQSSTADYCSAGVVTILGAVNNAGTIDLGAGSFPGSHLSVRGQFNSTGVVNLRGRTLSLDGSATGAVGGQVNLYGGSFATNDSAAIAADNLTIRGSGGISLNVLSGQVNFLGADTVFNLTGGVPAGVTYRLGEGAQLSLGATFSNAGQVIVESGSVFKTPWAGWGAWSGENIMGGGGSIGVGAGGRMEIASVEYHNPFGSHGYQWVAVENDLTIAPGGELRTLQASADPYFTASTSVIRGAVVNQGTINLGTESIAGSHLRITGSFANSGVINLHGRSLYLSPAAPDALAQFGGEVNIHSATFGDEAAPVSPGANPVVRGTGAFAMNLAGGQVNLRGAETSMMLRGGVGAGAKLIIDGGAYAEIDLASDPEGFAYRNDGEIIIRGAGAFLRGQQYGSYAYRKITGDGVIRIADGARMEVDSHSQWSWIYEYRGWTRIYNDLDIQAGGEFKTLWLMHAWGWSEVYGHVDNAGTLNVAAPLRILNDVDNQGLIHLRDSVEITGRLVNGGTILYDGGGISAGLGIEQLPDGEIRFANADDRTISKTGPGRVIVHPGQKITFAAGSSIDGWELTPAPFGQSIARIVSAQTDGACTPVGLWLDERGPFGAVLDLAGTAGRPLVLEMSYVDNDLDEAFERTLFLGWRSAEDEFVHAAEGNSARGAFAVEQFIGSWQDFMAAGGAGHTLADLLGSHGVDPAANRVWAVIDHNSAFTPVPEPSAALLLIAASPLLLRRRRTAQTA